MKVNVGEISEQLRKINNDLDEYDELYKSLFREVDMARSFWNDKRAEIFSSAIQGEKNQSIRLYNELSSRRDIFQYVRDEYSRSGNIINYDQNRKSDFLFHLSDAKNRINDGLIKLRECYEGALGYHSISAAGSFNNVLKNELDYFMRVIDDCYSEINRYLNDFDNIERNVQKKVDALQDYNYENYVPVKIPKVY